MYTVNKLKRDISRCERIMTRTKPIWETPGVMVGPLIAGGSNYSPSLSRKLDAENERKGRAFNEYEIARKEHERLTATLKGVEAGECHPNGQSRADAPSRIRRAATKKTVEELLAGFFKTHLQPGQRAGTVHGTVFIVKRINPKSITSTTVYYGEIVKYELTEVLLCGEDGQPISIGDMSQRVKAWANTQP